MQSLSDGSVFSYYTAVLDAQETTVISFDSGERSPRRKYILETLNYLQSIKGKPTIVLCSTSGTNIKKYLQKVPNKLRETVLSIKIFHLYIQLADQLQKILQACYYVNTYRKYFESFACAIRFLEADVIQQLSKLGVSVILDRSPITDYIYKKIQETDLKDRSLSFYDIYNYRPTCAFFVESSIDDQLYLREACLINQKFYDGAPELNINLKPLIPKLEQEGLLISLKARNTFAQNVQLIKQEIELALGL